MAYVPLGCTQDLWHSRLALAHLAVLKDFGVIDMMCLPRPTNLACHLLNYIVGSTYTLPTPTCLSWVGNPSVLNIMSSL